MRFLITCLLQFNTRWSLRRVPYWSFIWVIPILVSIWLLLKLFLIQIFKLLPIVLKHLILWQMLLRMLLRVSLWFILVDEIVNFGIRNIPDWNILVSCSVMSKNGWIVNHCWLLIRCVVMKHGRWMAFSSHSGFLTHGLDWCVAVLIVKIVLLRVHYTSDKRWLLGYLCAVIRFVMVRLMSTLEMRKWLLEFWFLSFKIWNIRLNLF